jgi:hypothetical protein
MRPIVAITGVALCWVGGASAQSPVPADPRMAALQRCTAMADDVARLACYDAALQRQGAPTAQAGQRAAVAPSPAQTPATGDAARPLAATKPDAPADFGLLRPRPAEEVRVIESRVKGRFEGWANGTRIELVNGQVWEVVDHNRATYDLPAPAVRVRRGMLGSFFLEIEGISATPRVRRIQ